MEPSPTPDPSIWHYVSENPLVSAIIAGLVVAIIIGIVKHYRNSKDGKTIYDFLRQSAADGRYTFRSTEAISSATKIPEVRVAELCSRHPYIKRNKLEKQSWQLDP